MTPIINLFLSYDEHVRRTSHRYIIETWGISFDAPAVLMNLPFSDPERRLYPIRADVNYSRKRLLKAVEAGLTELQTNYIGTPRKRKFHFDNCDN